MATITQMELPYTLHPGQLIIISNRKDDNLGGDDSFEVIVEIRYHSGSVCGDELGSWVLNVEGNKSVSTATCY